MQRIGMLLMLMQLSQAGMLGLQSSQVVLLLAPWSVQAGFLLRGSPGGDGYTSGLWAGHIKFLTQGKSKDMYEQGYCELQTPTSVLTGLDVNNFSYDPVTKGMILEIEDSSSSLIAYGTVCGTGQLKLLAGNVKLGHPDHPYFLDDTCGWRCGWNAFAYHGGQVYFILSAVFGKIPALLTREIQIRRLNQNGPACNKLVNTTNAQVFDVLSCSELLTSLHVASYTWPNPSINVFAGSAMAALRQTPNSPLQLYVQLFNKSTEGVHMTLQQVTIAEQVTSRQLYRTRVDTVYSGQWRVRGLGEITYRDGVLCWTAAEQLLCGLLQGESLDNVAQMIAPGEAHDAQVCTGALYPYPVGKVLTGVAIERVANPFTLYFGCYSQTAGVGGLGMLQVTATYAGATKLILNVTSDSSKVYGGTLFLLSDLERECGMETTPPALQYPTSEKLQADACGVIASSSGFTADPTIWLIGLGLCSHITKLL